MTKQNQIYKCEVCGNIVDVLHEGAGELVCCGQPMNLVEEKNEDEGKEKHVPVVEESGDGVKVKVGSIPHPMEEEHYIEWIEVSAGDRVYRNFLHPGMKPEVEFPVKKDAVEWSRDYCNVHGLWKAG